MVASLKIGVAEDELDMREFYQIVIPELGHRLLWAAQNGVELVEFANRARPDLLIVDIKMPLLDGLDAVRSVTRDHPLLVIVVSGHHDQETMERAEAEQLMGYLIKPIREADLRAAITIATKRFDELQLLREARARRSAGEAKGQTERVERDPSADEQREQITQQQALKSIAGTGKKRTSDSGRSVTDDRRQQREDGRSSQLRHIPPRKKSLAAVRRHTE